MRITSLETRETELGGIDFNCGIIADDGPIGPIIAPLLLSSPNNGKVAVTATKIAGMRDHAVLPA